MVQKSKHQEVESTFIEGSVYSDLVLGPNRGLFGASSQDMIEGFPTTILGSYSKQKKTTQYVKFKGFVHFVNKRNTQIKK